MCSLNWSFLEKVPQNYEHLTNWQISSVFKDSLNSGPLPLQNGICMVFPAWFSVDWLAKHPEMMWVFWFLIFSLDSPLSYLISPCSPEIAACYFFFTVLKIKSRCCASFITGLHPQLCPTVLSIQQFSYGPCCESFCRGYLSCLHIVDGLFLSPP